MVIATRDVPTKLVLTPDCSAMALAEPAKKGAASKTASDATAKPTQADLGATRRILVSLIISSTSATIITVMDNRHCLLDSPSRPRVYFVS